MPKIQFMSDIHLEYLGYKYDIPKTDADIVLLAGDIGYGLLGVEWAIRQSEALGIPIAMVFGNHDYYNQYFNTLAEQAKNYTEGTNVHILEKDTIEIGDTRIMGCTLWTDYKLYGEGYQTGSMIAAQDAISDHVLITYEDHIFTPKDALREHMISMDWLRDELDPGVKTVVVTHHAPTYHASLPSYRGDSCTPAFCSDLEDFIVERKPVVWINGHSHYSYRKQIGDTMCMSNPKGYRHEGVTHFDPELIVEV